MFATQHAILCTITCIYNTHIIEECGSVVVAENMCTDVCICVCVCVCVCVCRCAGVCVCVCMYVCVYGGGHCINSCICHRNDQLQSEHSKYSQ